LKPQAGSPPHDQRIPPAINVIALASFSASLSARALDPVLPHVAEDFGVTIATAAGFSAVFAFTFAIIQPVMGAAADLFGKARLMVVCLVLLGVANVLGALSTSFPLLFATRILAGIGSGGVFRSRSADKRSGRCRKAAGRDRAHTGRRHDRQPAGRVSLGPDR
jgi:predicted MFS family arabinose efflux permease